MSPQQVIWPVLFCFLSVCLPVNAAVYKWVDEHGQVHYGEKPGHSSAREVEIKPAPVTSGNSSLPASKQPVDRDKMIRLLEQERFEREESKSKKRKAMKQKKVNCAMAKDNLIKSQRARNVYRFDNKGDKVRMDTKQRQDVTDKYRADIKRYCN